MHGGLAAQSAELLVLAVSVTAELRFSPPVLLGAKNGIHLPPARKGVPAIDVHANISHVDTFYRLGPTADGQMAMFGQYADGPVPRGANTTPQLLSTDSGRSWTNGGRVRCGGSRQTADCFDYSPGLQTATGVRYIGNAVPRPIGAPPWTDYVNSHATEYTLSANGSAVDVRRISRPVRFFGGQLKTHAGCNLRWSRTLAGGIGFQGHGATQLSNGDWLLQAGACIGNLSRHDGPLRGYYAQSLVSFRSSDGWTWQYTATVAAAQQYDWSYYGPGGGESALAVLSDRKTVISVVRFDGNGGCDAIIPDDGHGPTTLSHYANYHQSYTRDGGTTWTRLRSIPRLGCVRPRLLMLSPTGPLLLSGGRACNQPATVGDRGVLLWMNLDGMAGANGVDYNSTWKRISVTAHHNRLWKGDPSFKFPSPALPFDTQAYTSLISTHPNQAVLTYNKYWCFGAPSDNARTPGGQATYPCRPPAENYSYAPSTSFAMTLQWSPPSPPSSPPEIDNGRLAYMGAYTATAQNLSGWANLVFVEHEFQVEEARKLGMRCLVRIDKLLFNKTESGGFSGGLRSDAAQMWARFLPNATRMMASSAIGFDLGDELADDGVPVAEIEAAAAMVRAQFPSAVIWINAAGWTVAGECRPEHMSQYPDWRPGCNASSLWQNIPPSVTWFSIDYYFASRTSVFFASAVQARLYHERFVYPKLSSHHRILLLPPAMGSVCKAYGCGLDCWSNQTYAIAKDTYAWAQEDPRVVAIAPYRLTTNPVARCDGATHWHATDLGLESLPRTFGLWKQIGRNITAKHAPVKVDEQLKCDQAKSPSRWLATGTRLQSVTQGNDGIRAFYIDAMDKAFPDITPASAVSTSVPIELWRGDHQPFQIALISTRSMTIVPKYVSESRGGPTVEWLRVSYVNVTTPVNNESRTGMFPDPLPSIRPQGEHLKPGSAVIFWITVHAPHHIASGTYVGTLQFEDADADANVDHNLLNITIIANVLNLSIPPPESATQITDARAMMARIDPTHCINEGPRMNAGCNLSIAIVKQWYHNMAEHRINSAVFGGVYPQIRATISSDLTHVQLDTQQFDDIMTFLVHELGFRKWRFPDPAGCTSRLTTIYHSLVPTEEWTFCCVQNRSASTGLSVLSVPVLRPGANHSSKFIDLNPEFKRLFTLIYAPVANHMQQKGWLENSYISPVDEMNWDNLSHAILRQLVIFFKKLLGVKVHNVRFPLPGGSPIWYKEDASTLPIPAKVTDWYDVR
eukprot:SAG31_NODE_671_length_12940_cov_4.703606_2_plen_1249_part_00